MAMQISTRRLVSMSVASFAAILLWDLSGLDLALAQTVGGPHGFALRDHWLLTGLLHNGAKYLAWVVIVGLCLGVAWPVGVLRDLPAARRLQLAVSALLASAFITLLKAGNHTSCPWDLHEFGGIARHVSHWAGWMDYDGGAGRCFPAGHATTGFAFVGGFFALRNDAPRLAKVWAGCALMAGFVLGFSQQLRGAHFLSHTLWTGWLCWMTAWAIDPLFARKGVASGAEVTL